jgi:predicted O-methyltransferase YrrM
MRRSLIVVAAMALTGLAGSPEGSCPDGDARPQDPPVVEHDLDAKVEAFLRAHRRSWRDMNVPERDGRALRDLIVEHGYTRALEIGTSTGHSAIWIAWGLAKTGGTLVTVEIDRSRHEEAVGHFEEAGLSRYIDARLADAHELVPALEGPFDFVFIDADKNWYVNYAKAVLPKIPAGGVMTAHNVSARSGWRNRVFGSRGADYYAYVMDQPNLDTTIINGQLAISFKTK